MTKKFFGAAVLLLAAAGAYATAKNTALDLVYIQLPGECRLVEAVKCDFTFGECVKEAFTIGTSTSLGNHQLYQNPPSGTDPICEVPLREFEP